MQYIQTRTGTNETQTKTMQTRQKQFNTNTNCKTIQNKQNMQKAKNNTATRIKNV